MKAFIVMNKSFFLKQFFKNIKHTGAVCASSKQLSEKMLEGIDFNKKLRIVELGPGTGSFTRAILEKMGPDSELIAIEINPEFCEKLQEFSDDPRFILHEASALDFSTKLDQLEADYVISGLPLANFKQQDIGQIFNEVKQTLRGKGRFIQFQYTPKLDRLIKRSFENVTKSFALFNLPPAFVYSCS